MRRPRSTFFLLVFVVVLGTTPSSGLDRRLAVSAGEEVLVIDGERLRGGADGATLRLPPGGELEAIARLDDGWLAVGVQPVLEDGQELLLVRSVHGAIELVPPPADERRGPRHDPVPLAVEGEFIGLAWLEGGDPTSNAVRASRWTGVGWTAPETVAPPGPGSQLALTGGTATEEFAILAWSAFDGEDDEILWSRWRDGEWSPPRRVGTDNRVPDITPALFADDDRVLLAWSRYDGANYRLHLATFEEDGWSVPRRVGGPGWLYPSWVLSVDETIVVLYDAGAGGWVALDIGGAGAIRAAASIPGSPDRRPTLVSLDGVTAVLLEDGTRRPLEWRPLSALRSVQ